MTQSKQNMHAQLVYVIIILSLVINQAFSQCTCSINKGQARCVYIDFSDINKRNNSQTPKEKNAIIVTSSANILPPNALSFENLQRAKIQCNLRTLTSTSFANQANLKELDLSENSISTIPNDMFEPIPLLEKLNLSHNTLEDPTLDTFYALNNLKILDISNNKISNLQLGVLDEMQKLENLYLRHNTISTIKLGLFDQLKKLKILDLSYNQIREIVLGLFDESKQLIEVNLAGNIFIGEIPLGTFDSLVNANTLILSNCKIEKLPLGIFDETEKIKSLDLSKNEITTLPVGIFDKLADLKILNMASCKLNEIPDKLFDQNSKLETFDLSNNKLRTLPELLFRLNNEALKYLNLSNNLIRELPIKIFQYTNLTEIDISYNKFTTIEPDLLNMETLEKVHAQYNLITYLDALTFATSNNPLKYLDIRHNRLVFLDPVFFEWVLNLERMDIFGNPWDCKCLNDLIAILSKKFIEFVSEVYYQGKLPICVSVGTTICDINMKNLTDYYEIYEQTT